MNEITKVDEKQDNSLGMLAGQMSEPETDNEVVLHEGNDLLPMIDKALSNPSVATDKLHKLLDFQERVMDRQAEIDFNQAMNALQLDMPVIKKDGSVQYPVDKNDPSKGMQKAALITPARKHQKSH